MPSDRPHFKPFSQYINFRTTLCKVHQEHINALAKMVTLEMEKCVPTLMNVRFPLYAIQMLTAKIHQEHINALVKMVTMEMDKTVSTLMNVRFPRFFLKSVNIQMAITSRKIVLEYSNRS